MPLLEGKTLNKLRAVTSTYQIKMKFPKDEIRKVKGDQAVA
jgi:hypothetical protein